MKWIRAVVPVLAFAVSVILQHARADTSTPAKDISAVLAEFDVYTDGDWLLVPVKVGGKTCKFVLDTGCASTFFDTALGLGSPVGRDKMKSASGFKELSLYAAPEISVGGIRWKSKSPVVGMDLSAEREVSAHDIGGMLGMDFLKTLAVRIDFDRGKLTLLRSPVAPAGRAEPIFFSGPSRTAAYLIGDIPGWGPERFMIDTGAMGGVSIQRDLFRELARKGEIKDLHDRKSMTLAGIEKSYAGIGRCLKIGGHLYPDDYICESTFPRSLVGLEFLHCYTIVLDFPQEKMYWRKSKWFDQPAPAGLSGLSFYAQNGRTVVDTVAEGSPAAKKGLKVGDVIVRLAGKDPRKIRPHELHALTSKEGESIPVVYRRDEEQREVVLALQTWDVKLPPPPAFLKHETAKKVRASLLYNRAVAHAWRNELDRALADADQALRLKPDHADAFMVRGQLQARKKDFHAAIADLSEAIRCAPDKSDAYWERARAHAALQDFKSAMTDFQTVHRLSPTNLIVAESLIALHVKQGDKQSALSVAEEALRLNPDRGRAFIVRGETFVALRQWQRAIDDLSKGMELDGPDFWALSNRAHAYQALKQFDNAIADYQKIVHLYPNSSEDPSWGAWGLLAWHLATAPSDRTRDGKRALACAQKACELTQYKKPTALEYLAAAYAECGNFEEAVRWQKRALELYTRESSLRSARPRLDLYEKGLPAREE